MKERIKREFIEFKVLMRSIPSLFVTLFCVSVIAMNLLANKSIDGLPSWLALDVGFTVSWMAFLTMDVVTKYFGLKAANELTFVGIGVNLLLSLLFFVGSVIPGQWGESFVEVGGDLINTALDNTFGGTWFVLLGSTVAFAVSGILNNVLNWVIGKIMKNKKDNYFTFALRTFVSTGIGQFVDNLLFALIVSLNFFGWSIPQCLMCAATGAVAELLCEVIFSHFGYYMSKKWKKDNVGQAYFDLVNSYSEAK